MRVFIPSFIAKVGLFVPELDCVDSRKVLVLFVGTGFGSRKVRATGVREFDVVLGFVLLCVVLCCINYFIFHTDRPRAASPHHTVLSLADWYV